MNTRNILIIVILGCIGTLMVLGFLVAKSMHGEQGFEPLPSPNGYDLFVQATQSMPALQKDFLDNPANYKVLHGTEAMEKLLEPWKPAFALVDTGLTHESRMPYERPLSNHNSLVQQSKQCFHLGQAIRAQAKLHEAKDELSQAVDGYLKMMRFSGEAFRGCVLIEVGLSVALTEIGCQDIRGLIPKMDQDLCKTTLDTLKEIKTRRESFESIAENEDFFVRQNFSAFKRIMALVAGRGQLNPALPKFKQKWDKAFENLSQLESELEAHAKSFEINQTNQEAIGNKTGPQQAIMVHLDGVNLPDSVYQNYDTFTIEEKLGAFDGTESGPKETTLLMYGPDAERLFSGIEQALRDYPLCKGARVVIRLGGPGAEEREVRL